MGTSPRSTDTRASVGPDRDQARPGREPEAQTAISGTATATARRVQSRRGRRRTGAGSGRADRSAGIVSDSVGMGEPFGWGEARAGGVGPGWRLPYYNEAFVRSRMARGASPADDFERRFAPQAPRLA